MILEENRPGEWTLPNFQVAVTQTVRHQVNREINGIECRAQKQTYMSVVNVYIVSFDRGAGEGTGNPLQYSCVDRIPWTEAPGGLQFTGSQSVRHD